MAPPAGWTYSGDPSTSDVDQVRFTLQDVDGELPLLLDLEIQWLIDEWLPRYSSLTYVAAVAAAVVSRKFAGIVSVSADGVSVNTADLSQRYRDLAVQLHQEYQAAQVGGEVDISNVLIGTSVDYSIRPLRFGLNLHDNPDAGLQDFGSWTYDPFRTNAPTELTGGVP
jgi:hypothetical protein